MPLPQPLRTLAADLKRVLVKDETSAAALIGEIAVAFPDQAADAYTSAARGSRKRAETLVALLFARGDKGCAISDRFIAGIIADTGHEQRSLAIQLVAFDAARTRFAPALREIAKDRNDPDWAWAVGSLGKVEDLGAVDVLMGHTRGQETPFVLLDTLRQLRCPEAALVFEANLTHPEPRTRVFALWGLAALEYEAARGALVHWLDDPDVRTETSFEPGQSHRAAQALADLHGWPFEWGSAASFEDIKRRSRERYSQDFVQRCLRALSQGRRRLG